MVRAAPDPFAPLSGPFNTIDAIVGGVTAGPTYYLCKGQLNGGTHPGRITTGWNACRTAWGGSELDEASTEVLQTTWASVAGGHLPPNAVVFGADTDMSKLYICRAQLAGGTYLGKTHAGWTDCLIGLNGTEQFAPSYEVLLNTFPMTGSTLTQAGTNFDDYAILGGGRTFGGSLWICTAPWQGGFHPGYVGPGTVGCHFSYGGAEMTATQDYYVLVPEFTSSTVNPNFVTGHEADGTPLFTCQAEYPAGSHDTWPGKWRTDFAGCHIGYNNTELEVSPFKILNHPQANPIVTQNVTFTALGQLCPFGTPVQGDRDFSGHGPAISVDAQLTISADQRSLLVTVRFDALETSGDHSEIRGEWTQTVWTTPSPNIAIVSIDNNDSSSVHLTGTAAGPEIGVCRDGAVLHQGPFSSGLIQSLDVIGDTGGDDISSDANCSCDTQIRGITFNAVTIETRAF